MSGDVDCNAAETTGSADSNLSGRHEFAVSAADRSFPWKLRSDLTISSTTVGGNSGAERLIRDPLRLTYFQTSADEATLLQLLDGRRSLRQITELLNQQSTNSPRSITEVVSFLQTAARAQLLTCFRPRLMSGTQHSPARMSIFRVLTGWLSFRLRGPDPNRLLRRWCSATPFLDGRLIHRVWPIFQLFVLFQVFAHWPRLVSELPDLAGVFTADTLLPAIAALAGIRILHELGHACSCVRRGGECHDLGVLFVAFLPLLYCDVSDSWRFPRRRDRIRVAAAGILTESRLAAVCGLLWLCSEPGMVHTACLNILLISSVSTLVINANPLMRFDGYYILSDLIDVPNLHSESRLALDQAAGRLVFGHALFPRHRGHLAELLLATFAAASLVWRTVVIGSLLLFVSGLLRPVGLQMLAVLPVIGMLPGSTGRMLAMLKRNLLQSPRPLRSTAGLVLLLSAVAACLLVPVRLTVDCPALLTPGQSAAVFVRVPGRLDAAINFGESVTAGQTIAKLSNPDLQLQLQQAETEQARLQSRLNRLDRIRADGSQNPAGRNSLAAALKSVSRRVETLREMLQQLEITSPASGIILAVRNQPLTASSPRTATTWTKYALQSESVLAWLDSQTLLCWVGTPDDCQVQGWLTQEEIELVDTQQPAIVRFFTQPQKQIPAQVISTAAAANESPARELVLTGRIAVSPQDASKTRQPMFTVNVRATGTPFLRTAPIYHTATLQLQTHPISLAEYSMRMLQSVFRIGTNPDGAN